MRTRKESDAYKRWRRQLTALSESDITTVRAIAEEARQELAFKQGMSLQLPFTH